jgi:lipopolysaccharide assembly protein A
VLLVLFASVNWHAVTLRLWGGLEADVKLPVLVLAAFLLGFLPPLLLMRARIWSLRRKLDAHERQIASTFAEPVAPPADLPPPPPPPRGGDRIATDSKVWPAP